MGEYMRFNVFSVWDIIGKKLIWAIIITVSFGAVGFFFITDNKEVTYIAATIYAMFLFCAGIYLAYIDKKTDSLIYKRKEYYLTLKKLGDVFETRGQLESDDEMYEFIISMWGFTGRGIDNNDKHPLIRENGFRFKEKLYEMECNYYKKRNDFHKSFLCDVNTYLKKNKIISKESFFSELSLLDTNYDEWGVQNIEDEHEREEVIAYIYSLIERQQGILDEIEIDRKRLKKSYDRCNKKLIWNIRRIENVYGDALQNLIFGDEQVFLVLEELKNQLEEVEGKVCDIQNDINEEFNESLNRHTQWVMEKIDEVCYDIIDEMRGNIDDDL